MSLFYTLKILVVFYKNTCIIIFIWHKKKGINEVRLIGNLTKDLELQTSENGVTYCRFSIATNRSWKEEGNNIKTEATYHNIVCFAKLAETANQYLKKGSKVYILGRLENSKYIKNNETRTISQTIMTNMIMLDKKPTDQTEQEAPTDAEDIEVNADDTEPIPF